MTLDGNEFQTLTAATNIFKHICFEGWQFKSIASHAHSGSSGPCREVIFKVILYVKVHENYGHYKVCIKQSIIFGLECLTF